MTTADIEASFSLRKKKEKIKGLRVCCDCSAGSENEGGKEGAGGWGEGRGERGEKKREGGERERGEGRKKGKVAKWGERGFEGWGLVGEGFTQV